MSIADVERYNPNNGFYNLDNKLWENILLRSEAAFDKAEKRRAAILSREELTSYCDEMRKWFIDAMGGIPYNKDLPLNAKTVGEICEEELTIEKVIFSSRPGVYITANLYIPKERKNPCGAVLLHPGHTPNGKAYASCQHVARAICGAGLIVLIIDPIGQGERLSYFEPELNMAMIPPAVRDHLNAGEQCVLTGKPITRYFIADAMRAIDYLESRPEVDKEKIGVTGSSGGGTATCHLMLCDQRIKAAAPGTFVTNRRSYLYAGGPQDSEQIWIGATKQGFDHFEPLMCFAPKPLLLILVDTDFFPIEGSLETYDTVKRFWEMSGQGNNIKYRIDNSLHEYTDGAAIAAAEFFSLHLNGEKCSVDISKLTAVSENMLQCTKSGKVSVDFNDAKFVRDENIEELEKSGKPEKSLKDFLLEKMNFQREREPLCLRTFPPMYESGLKISPYMWFAQKRIPNYGLMFSDFSKKQADTVICLWDKGTDSIEEHIYKITEIIQSGKQAFVLDLSGSGKCTPHKLNTGKNEKDPTGAIYRLSKDLMFLGDSLCAIKLFELNYALEMIRETFGGEVTLYAEGVSANIARLMKETDCALQITVDRAMPCYGELVRSKYYIDYNLAGIILPGIARYFAD